MIIGFIPVGGGGRRLGLSFPKEMLPQKGFEQYSPIISHVIDKMLLAGAEKIYFIHGKGKKREICRYFKDKKYVHITQETEGFARVFEAFYKNLPEGKHTILFGLPDSFFSNNPFMQLIREPGVVCGLFQTDEKTRVDRVNKNGLFDVKSVKNENNQEWFWGVLKFDSDSFRMMVENTHFDEVKEVGVMLNNWPTKTMQYNDKYKDLGTWGALNEYWREEVRESNREIERKYNANDVSFEDFDKLMRISPFEEHLSFSSWDYYFDSPNPNIQFVRFREGSPESDKSKADITVKDGSTLNRFELSIKVDKTPENSKNILDLLQIIGLKFAFKVKKTCSIYKWSNAEVVMYEMDFMGVKIKFIEIESKAGIRELALIEPVLEGLPGFRKEVITRSKYLILKEIYGQSTQ